MKTLRGKGEFVSIAGVVWRVELWVDGYTGSPVEMAFPHSSPLEINWGEYDRLEPVEGSTASLRVISKSDREWMDLYSIERTRVRLDVYRDGELYWQGTLDSEFYEEPFEMLQGYEVSLTFSDLGVLEDVDYDMTGTLTLSDVIDRGIELAGLTIGIDESRISTSFTDGERLTLSSLSVRSDNYYDEDGEASNYKEVIGDLLQPLALKIRQRGGKFIVYDLNGLSNLHAENSSEELCWDGDSQTMAMAEVAQKIKVSLSPYGESELLADNLEYTGKTSPDVRNTTSSIVLDSDFEYAEYFTFFNDYTARLHSSAENVANEYEDFNLFLSPIKGKGLAEIHSEARYAKFVPIFGSASERTCVAWLATVGLWDGCKFPLLENTQIIHKGAAAWCTRGSEKIILRTKRVYVAGYTPKSHFEVKRYLRLTLPLLMDARYNPFDGKTDNPGNEQKNDYYIKVRTGYMFIPVGVTIYDAPQGGNTICHYDNSRTAANTSRNPVGNGVWKSGQAQVGDMWLEYYSTSDMKEDTGIRGWNKASIDIHDGMIEIFGQYCCNIRFGVDDDGYAVLEYYDNNGKLLYDLGPKGIRQMARNHGYWDTLYLTRTHSADKTAEEVSAAFRSGLLIYDSSAFGTYYRYHGGSSVLLDVNDGKIFTGKDTASAFIADGWYKWRVGRRSWKIHLSRQKRRSIQISGTNHP